MRNYDYSHQKIKYKTYNNTPIAYYSCSIKQNSKSPNIATFQKIEKENNFCFNEIILTKPKLSNIAILQKMQKENNFCFSKAF